MSLKNVNKRGTFFSKWNCNKSKNTFLWVLKILYVFCQPTSNTITENQNLGIPPLRDWNNYFKFKYYYYVFKKCYDRVISFLLLTPKKRKKNTYIPNVSSYALKGNKNSWKRNNKILNTHYPPPPLVHSIPLPSRPSPPDSVN